MELQENSILKLKKLNLSEMLGNEEDRRTRTEAARMEYGMGFRFLTRRLGFAQQAVRGPIG
jgi:hypothetical protein